MGTNQTNFANPERLTLTDIGRKIHEFFLIFQGFERFAITSACDKFGDYAAETLPSLSRTDSSAARRHSIVSKRKNSATTVGSSVDDSTFSNSNNVNRSAS
jgi:hypothetical protein